MCVACTNSIRAYSTTTLQQGTLCQNVRGLNIAKEVRIVKVVSQKTIDGVCEHELCALETKSPSTRDPVLQKEVRRGTVFTFAFKTMVPCLSSLCCFPTSSSSPSGCLPSPAYRAHRTPKHTNRANTPPHEGTNLSSRVLFRKRELNELCTKLGQF